MPTLLFRKENVTFHCPEGTNLRQACLDAGIDVYPALGGLLSCRGKGFCGTCVVEVQTGKDGDEHDPSVLSAPSKREQSFLKRLNPKLAERLRLSCQAEVQGDMTVVTDPNKKEAWKTHPYYSGRHTHSWDQPK